MARCGCASDRCDCTIVAGNWVTIYGTGTKSNPYVIEGTQPVIEVGGEGGGAGRLIGEIVDYGGDVAPAGWLICDGTPKSRAIYAALFAVINTTFGAGDGVNTFNIPNYQDRSPMGASGSKPRGTQGGVAGGMVTLGVPNMPPHVHNFWHDHGPINTAGSSVGAPYVNTTSTGGHEHGMKLSASQGSSATVRRGDGTYATGFGAGESGGVHFHGVTIPDHVHWLDIPPHSGDTDQRGGGEAFSVQSPFLAANRIIYTGVGV